MKNRSGFKPGLKKLNTNTLSFTKKLIAKIFTLSFWKKTAFAGFVVMASIGSYVTLKSFDFTKSIVETVEKPVVRSWKAFTDESYKPSKKIASSSKKIKKSSYKPKKSKYAKKSKSKSRYSKNSRKKKSGKVLRSSYKYVNK